MLRNILLKLNSIENTKDYVYLDNAGATPVSDLVLNKMKEVENFYANPSGIYRIGVYANKKIDDCRKDVSQILNCHTNEIIWTGSGTESNNLAIFGIINNFYNKPEDKNEVKYKPIIITSNIEHSSILEPLYYLQKNNKIEIEFLKVDESGSVIENDLRNILKEKGNRVILVTTMYVNNETGRVQPVKEIGRIIDEYNRTQKSFVSIPPSLGEGGQGVGVIYHIDACQAANYLDLDVRKLRCHMMTINSSKIYGPKGVALIYKNKDVTMEPIIMGGGQEGGLRSGTENLQSVVGFVEALKESQKIKEKEVVRLIELQDYFFDKIRKEIEQVIIYTEQNNINKILDKEKNKINYFNIDSIPNNINIGLPGMTSEEMVIRLDQKGFAVSHKSACAAHELSEGSYVLMAMGASEQAANENIRISMGRSTTKDNLDNLIKFIKEIYSKYRK